MILENPLFTPVLPVEAHIAWDKKDDMIGQEAEYAALEMPGPRTSKISYKRLGWYTEAANVDSPLGIGEVAHVNSTFKLNERHRSLPKGRYTLKQTYENPGYPRV
jgi:hypothetical protein